MSLRRKFVLVLATFSVVLAAVFGFLSWRIASDALESELERRLVQVPGAVGVTGFIQGNLVLDLRPGYENEPVWEEYRRRLARLLVYVDDAFVFDARGARVDRGGDGMELTYPLLVGTDSTLIGTPLRALEVYEAEIEEALRTGASTTPTFPGEDGRLYKYGFVRLEDTPAILGVLAPADFYAPRARLGATLIWVSLAAILLAVVLGGVLATTVAGPLERLSRVALRIQRGHMERPVEVERGDELGRLSRAMERMRQGILERDEQLRLMLAQVAHEIRNPLGGLELFASAAAETEDPAERRRLLGRVRDEVGALNRIINDFLTYARPSEIDRERTDLRWPIGQAADLVRGTLEEEGADLEMEMADEPLMAVVDGDQVKRAVLNLLRNAAHVAGRIKLVAERSGTEILIRVADDGPGVSEALEKRIFEPFVTDKEKGAGLGLAIVKKVVESHGGRVEVGTTTDGELGRGAEFRIYFPGLDEPLVESLSEVP